ncbi:hypothetical protein FF38_01421 [Lucilia cuprina]|uniref:Uncharacterized protein n=1 Tax=Lucilia cuprina TaxID=7375 RepID=A0A0L0CAB2_LUCCU|nr:hypothetical protein FF38_01421 [Lucilia cuprina]
MFKFIAVCFFALLAVAAAKPGLFSDLLFQEKRCSEGSSNRGSGYNWSSSISGRESSRVSNMVGIIGGSIRSNVRSMTNNSGGGSSSISQRSRVGQGRSVSSGNRSSISQRSYNTGFSGSNSQQSEEADSDL